MTRRFRTILKKFPGLRSGFYLLRELARAALESGQQTREFFETEYAKSEDPYDRDSDSSTESFAQQAAMLDSVYGPFGSAFEIGCGEGVFTPQLAQRCQRVLAVDVSSIALERALARCQWPANVEFRQFNLLTDPIPETFDLVLACGVLEYIARPSTLQRVREKIVSAIRPGGYLLIDTWRANEVIERAKWGRLLVRGTHHNEYFGKHPGILSVQEQSTPNSLKTLYRKRPF